MRELTLTNITGVIFILSLFFLLLCDMFNLSKRKYKYLINMLYIIATIAAIIFSYEFIKSRL